MFPGIITSIFRKLLSAAETFTIGGTGDLTVNEVAQSVETVDAVKAAGDLNLDLSKSRRFSECHFGLGATITS